jgi:hypothetical protein
VIRNLTLANSFIVSSMTTLLPTRRSMVSSFESIVYCVGTTARAIPNRTISHTHEQVNTTEVKCTVGFSGHKCCEPMVKTLGRAWQLALKLTPTFKTKCLSLGMLSGRLVFAVTLNTANDWFVSTMTQVAFKWQQSPTKLYAVRASDPRYLRLPPCRL